MDNKPQYLGSLTREQFLYYENRIVAKLILQGKSYDEILLHYYSGASLQKN